MTLNGVSRTTNPAYGLNQSSSTCWLEPVVPFKDEICLGGKLVQAERRPHGVHQGHARPRQDSGATRLCVESAI